MRTYKRTLFELIKGIVIAPFSAFAAHIILGLFTSNAIVVLGIPALAGLAILYLAVFSENIRFELEPDGVFRYYKRGIPQNTFNLKTCYIWYHRKSEGGFPPSHDITLTVRDTAAGEDEIRIDCGPLGLNQFNEMFAGMEEFTMKDKTVLAAGSAKIRGGEQA
jgi:predicted Rdx family selenoprotein